jgi:uncharacterized membrane protein (DUF485 family)
MLGMMQIMIWLFCLYLVFKGVEIFQIAFTSARTDWSRKTGIVLGVVMVGVAIVATAVFIFLEESMAAQVTESQKNIFNR